MKNYLFSPVIAAMVMSLVATVDAGLIIQERKSWGLQIRSFSPIGQTFTAEDAQIISIGFWVKDWNPSFGPIDLTVQLFQGVGTGGPSLGSAPIEGLSPGFDGFYDADFTSVSLTVGPGLYGNRIQQQRSWRCLWFSVGLSRRHTVRS